MKNILNVIRSSHKRQSTANERYVKRQVSVKRAGAPSHFPTEYRHEAAVVSREHNDEISGSLGRSLSMTTAMGV